MLEILLKFFWLVFKSLIAFFGKLQMILSNYDWTHHLGLTFFQCNLDLIFSALIWVIIICQVTPHILVNWFVVVLSKHDESLAKWDVIFCIQVYKCPLAQFTSFGVVDWFLKSDHNPCCTVWVYSEDVKISLFIYGGVVRARLPVHLSALLQVNTFNKFLEISPNLRSSFVLNSLKNLKLSCWSLPWNISFQRDGCKTANFFAETHFALRNSRYHGGKFDDFDIVPLLGLVFNIFWPFVILLISIQIIFNNRICFFVYK